MKECLLPNILIKHLLEIGKIHDGSVYTPG